MPNRSRPNQRAVTLPAPLWQRLQATAEQERTTISDLIRTAVVESLTRKEIEMSRRKITDREAVIQQIAGRIHEVESIAHPGEEPNWEQVNAEGWTLDVRLPSAHYYNGEDHTRLEGVILTPAELQSAIAQAQAL